MEGKATLEEGTSAWKSEWAKSVSVVFMNFIDSDPLFLYILEGSNAISLINSSRGTTSHGVCPLTKATLVLLNLLLVLNYQ